MEMTRGQYMELFGLKEFDVGMDDADDWHDVKGMSWWEIAKMSIRTMNGLLLHEDD